MLIASYNPDAMGDTLIVVLAQDQPGETHQQFGDIVAISDAQGKVVGYNFFNVSQILGTLSDRGQVLLTDTQVDKLNAAITAAGAPGQLVADHDPKLVIGVVNELAAHPDSDHLHVGQIDVGWPETVQIVCGAPNVAAGQHVVVALPGAMMPTGQIIWPGALRGVDSYGMICAARELGVPGAPDRHGILVMPDDLAAGTPFDMDVAIKVVAAQA